MPLPDLSDVARRHGVSAAAVETIWSALRATGGRSAQFDHPDLGGFGQWMPGMVQVGDMFNTALRAKVDALCAELAAVLRDQPTGALRTEDPAGISPAPWWPGALGTPDAAGGQNDVRYAWFAGPRRLAVQRAGGVTLYDTAGQRITGVSQQHSGGSGTLVFSTDRGTLDLDSLAPVDR